MDSNMKSTSKQFTKPDSSSASGRGNTLSRFCCLILLSSLPETTKNNVQETLGENVDDNIEEVEDQDETEYVCSQTYPEFFQS